MIRGKLIEKREKRGLTQEKLAEQVGVDVATVRRWESGDVSPHGRNKWKLMETLGVETEDALDLDSRRRSHDSATSFIKQGFVVHLATMVFDSSARVSPDVVQTQRSKLEGALGEKAMGNNAVSRREALLFIAALP